MDFYDFKSLDIVRDYCDQKKTNSKLSDSIKVIIKTFLRLYGVLNEI